MSNASFLLLLALYLLMVSMSIFPTIEGATSEHRLRWVATTTPTCQGSIEECIEDGEFGMDSESHRRILATSQYISYRALQRNTVPCSHKGASYYNCQKGAEANPYSRGCTTITRCRNT
ncbi:rapid alkalinization factor [Cicer arietinum]|uniref:Rapid alkalinization factor n=1 Tax=Cicer arietinum TaxID=3827 RepID=A0A1S2XVL5_CICAR|nr:rapid alkalinization factor [Cicer arietinum]